MFADARRVCRDALGRIGVPLGIPWLNGFVLGASCSASSSKDLKDLANEAKKPDAKPEEKKGKEGDEAPAPTTQSFDTEDDQNKEVKQDSIALLSPWVGYSHPKAMFVFIKASALKFVSCVDVWVCF